MPEHGMKNKSDGSYRRNASNANSTVRNHNSHSSRDSHFSHLANDRLLPPRGNYQILLDSKKQRSSTTSPFDSRTSFSPEAIGLSIK
jgi:hypothetical protein